MKYKKLTIPKDKYSLFISYSQKLPWNEMIQMLREHSGRTQQQIANAININRKTYSNYEAGISDMSVETIKKLANLYGVPSSVILGETDLMKNFTEVIKND